MTNKRTWKSNAFLISVSVIGSILLCSALVSTVRLPILTSAGLLSWLVLLGLTLAASRFTVSITNTVGVSQSRKSVADALVFLAIILYAVPPATTAGPATLRYHTDASRGFALVGQLLLWLMLVLGISRFDLNPHTAAIEH